MPNITISDLTKEIEISKKDMVSIIGGFSPAEPIMEGPGWNPDGVVISIMVETELGYEEAMFFSEDEGGTEPDYWKKK